MYSPVANSLQLICTSRNYECWLAVGKVIAIIMQFTFFEPPCTCSPMLANFDTFKANVVDHCDLSATAVLFIVTQVRR